MRLAPCYAEFDRNKHKPPIILPSTLTLVTDPYYRIQARDIVWYDRFLDGKETMVQRAENSFWHYAGAVIRNQNYLLGCWRERVE